LGAERARSELAADPALRAEMLRVIGAIQRRLGATDDAAATLDAASDAARAAGAALPAVESAQLGYELGVLQSIAGDLDAAERSFEGIAGLLASDQGAAAGVLRAQALGELVVVAQGRGDLDSAFARLADAEAAVARLEPPNPYERMVVRNLRVAVLNDAGRYAEASALATEIVADARTSGIADRGTFAQLLANASKLADAAGDRPLAVAHAEEGVRFARARYPTGHFVVADAMLALGNAYRTSGRHAEAAQALREAMAMFGAGGRTGQRGETAMVLGRSLVDNGDPRAALELADAELAAAGEWEDRPATRVLGLLDVALRAARELDRAAFVRHAADAERELAALPVDLRAQPMVQRVRRRLAQWRFDDGVVDEAARLAADGIAASSAAPAPTADELIMRAVAVRASRVEREATAEFDRIVAALALQPSLGAAEAEARLAIAQAAMAIGRADAKAYLDAALQAHAAKPLPAALAAQLDALAARR
ncbi:MAG TPA: tetratricopeptide repeat protein, partial [Xanthomonadales bacterium]|nr:tetratricopeptide repeat protein [Xanthomonadales bacterium]